VGWWGPGLLALPLVATDWTFPHGLMKPTGAFIPPLVEWIHNGLFYVAGLALYHQHLELFARYRRHWGRYAAAGFITFVISGALIDRQGTEVPFAFVYSLTSWLWSFAAIGLALRVLDQRSRVLAYLADSSYWVYLVHLP